MNLRSLLRDGQEKEEALEDGKVTNTPEGSGIKTILLTVLLKALLRVSPLKTKRLEEVMEMIRARGLEAIERKLIKKETIKVLPITRQRRLTIAGSHLLVRRKTKNLQATRRKPSGETPPSLSLTSPSQTMPPSLIPKTPSGTLSQNPNGIVRLTQRTRTTSLSKRNNRQC